MRVFIHRATNKNPHSLERRKARGLRGGRPAASSGHPGRDRRRPAPSAMPKARPPRASGWRGRQPNALTVVSCRSGPAPSRCSGYSSVPIGDRPVPVVDRKRTTRIQSKRAAARRGPAKDQHARGSEPAMSRHRRPHSSRLMPQTSSEISAGGMQHASTNATHGESPKSFRLLSRGPVRLGERCTCYYLPFYEMQQSSYRSRSASASLSCRVTLASGRACLGMDKQHKTLKQIRSGVPTRWRGRSQARDG